MVHMGQALIRRRIDNGRRLYHMQKYDKAIKQWRSCVRDLRQDRDRFLVLGYLAMVNSDIGYFRDMLHYCSQQMEIANKLDDEKLKAEAFLNLARSNIKLAEYHKAICYCRHSLQHMQKEARMYGFVFLCLGNAYYGFSNFVKAFEHLELARQLATQNGDKTLELQVLKSLGLIYLTLKDHDSAMQLFLRACDLAKTFSVSDLSAKYQRLTCMYLSFALRKMGRLEDAHRYCENALRLAISQGDRPIQAKCLCYQADIFLASQDLQKAYPRFESSLLLFIEIGDTYGQIEALSGTLLYEKNTNICDCKAIEVNHRALQLAHSVGNKIHVLKCRQRLEKLYGHLGDYDQMREQTKAIAELQVQMDLSCGICGRTIGSMVDRISVLPQCGHFFHARCAMQLERSRQIAQSMSQNCNLPGQSVQFQINQSSPVCPKCNKSCVSKPIYV